MKMYSYVVKNDTGFAPNPFWGYCTLATCKPGIRKGADVGDWVIGTGSVANVGRARIIYSMKVSEILPLDQYFADPRFECKKPAIFQDLKQRLGDNLYFKNKEGEWEQYRPLRYKSLHPSEADIKHDLSGLNVLIAIHFYYFGNKAPEIPPNYLDLLVVRGYKYNHDLKLVTGFLDWIQSNFQPGQQGIPSTNIKPLALNLR